MKKSIHFTGKLLLLYILFVSFLAGSAVEPWVKEKPTYILLADDDDDNDSDNGDDGDNGDDDNDDNGGGFGGGSQGGFGGGQSSGGSFGSTNTGTENAGSSGGSATPSTTNNGSTGTAGGTKHSDKDSLNINRPPPKGQQRGGFFSLFTRQEPLKESVEQPLSRYRPNTVLVVYRGCKAVSGVSGMQVKSSRCLTSMNVRLVKYRLNNMNVSQGIKRLRRQKRAVSVQPDYFYQSAGKSTVDYGHQLIKIDKKPPTYSGDGVVVGLIDSMVDTRHKALKNADIVQHNLFNLKNKSRHATAIAGILLAHHKVYGIAPDIRLISIPAFYIDEKKRQVTSTYYLMQALEKMQQQKIQLLNLSFVGHKDSLVERAIKKLQKKGVIVVAAAGNAGGRSAQTYPAAYASVIGVTAVDVNQQLYDKATIGRHVDYAAPGVNLLALAPRGRYGLVSGTSYATPYVTGLLALLKQQNSSGATILKKLRKHAKDLGKKGKNIHYGHGLIQAPW